MVIDKLNLSMIHGAHAAIQRPKTENHMAQNFSLESIASSRRDAPVRCVIYGPPGVGKTTMAAAFPSPILLRVEDGASEIDVPTFGGVVQSMQDLDGALNALRADHTFKTLIIDSIDWLEPIIWSYTAKSQNKDSIEDFGYGKGYVMAADVWRRVLAKLDVLVSKGMNVVLIAHSQTTRFDPPDSEPYMRYDIKLHSRASDVIKEWASAIYFINYVVTVRAESAVKRTKGKGVGDGARCVYTSERPAFIAKSRKALPDSFDIDSVTMYKPFVDMLFSNKENAHD